MPRREGKKRARGSGLGARGRTEKKREKKEKMARTEQIPAASDGEAHCVHCHSSLGELHDNGCLYAGPPLAKDRKRTGVSGLVTEADCEGRGVVHTNASLGLLPKPRRPRMSQPITPERFEELVNEAGDLVAGGHREGRLMFELLDEVDRLEGRPPTSARIGSERGWNLSEGGELSKRKGK